MGFLNVLIRTGPTHESGAQSERRAVALDDFLRRVSPQTRVTVFAEGDEHLQNALYPCVRDLVSLPIGVTPGEEASFRCQRDAAEVVILDSPTADESAWSYRTRRVIRVQPESQSLVRVSSSKLGEAPLLDLDLETLETFGPETAAFVARVASELPGLPRSVASLASIAG